MSAPTEEFSNAEFNPTGFVAIDSETTGLNPWKNDAAFAVGLCDSTGKTWYCEWPVDPFTRKVAPVQSDLDQLRIWLEDPALEKIFHNAKFDVRMLENCGLSIAGKIHDTHIAARVANNDEFTYGLKVLANKYLKIPSSDEKDLKTVVAKYRRQAQSYNRAALKEDKPTMQLGEATEADYWLPRYYDPEDRGCEKYCRLDVVRTMGLHLMYKGILESDEALQRGYEQEMFELWPVVMKMEKRGMRVDCVRVEDERVSAVKAKAFHLNRMIELCRTQGLKPFEDETPLEKFNPSSAPQLRRVLYLPKSKGGLGLTTTRLTDSGDLSADKNALRELMGEDFVRDLVGFRASKQAIGLFFEKFLDLAVPCHISEGERCIHPGLNQCGTSTFRFSSSSPNMQQVGNPKTAHNVASTYHPRAAFGPREGYFMYAGDYAQQELRLFASISENPFLLEEIRAGRDPNSACANKAWGGKDNPQALKAAAIALDMGRETPTSELVAATWKEIGWNPKAARELGERSAQSLKLAEEWLASFDYDIVVAEKSVGRSNSRGRAKCVMFAKIYGGGPSSVTELLYCSLAEAQTFLHEYDTVMPELNQYMSYMIGRARKDRYIINPYGRKLRIDPDFAYKAVNWMIQSTAACQIKDSIVRCDKFFVNTGLDAHVLLTIHDELIFEIRQRDAYKWLLRGIQEIMGDNNGRILVPTPVELKRIRSAWSEKESLDI